MLRLFRVPAGYSLHTSISALNIRYSLFSSVLHSGLGGFFSGGAQDTDNITRKPKAILVSKGPGRGQPVTTLQ